MEKEFDIEKRPPFEKTPDITQEKRDTLIHFNTLAYNHCFFDKETKKLYSEYGYLILEDATEYLTKRGLINSNLEQIKHYDF
jgi:hypothetical protein